MSDLTWTFDWVVWRAECSARHGTYVIVRRARGEWAATFTRADTEAYRRTARVLGHVTVFPSMADALHTCLHHADHYRPETSDRLQAITPPPQ